MYWGHGWSSHFKFCMRLLRLQLISSFQTLDKMYRGYCWSFCFSPYMRCIKPTTNLLTLYIKDMVDLLVPNCVWDVLRIWLIFLFQAFYGMHQGYCWSSCFSPYTRCMNLQLIFLLYLLRTWLIFSQWHISWHLKLRNDGNEHHCWCR